MTTSPSVSSVCPSRSPYLTRTTRMLLRRVVLHRWLKVDSFPSFTLSPDRNFFVTLRLPLTTADCICRAHNLLNWSPGYEPCRCDGLVMLSHSLEGFQGLNNPSVCPYFNSMCNKKWFAPCRCGNSVSNVQPRDELGLYTEEDRRLREIERMVQRAQGNRVYNVSFVSLCQFYLFESL